MELMKALIFVGFDDRYRTQDDISRSVRLSLLSPVTTICTTGLNSRKLYILLTQRVYYRLHMGLTVGINTGVNVIRQSVYKMGKGSFLGLVRIEVLKVNFCVCQS